MADPAHDKVVEMYEAGTRVPEIMKATGYSRSAIYWILRQRGLRPGGASTVDTRLAELERRVAALEEKLDGPTGRQSP